MKKHPDYAAAKSGDIAAAERLVADTVSQPALERLLARIGDIAVELVPVHALETHGVNEIPAALAKHLAPKLGARINDSIVQINTVGHTGASGYHRLANQAIFAGSVVPGRAYLVVDDFVGQGGTLANLIGHIESANGRVTGATALTGKPYSAIIAPDEALVRRLRDKYGTHLEQWWQETFGFGFDQLTRSEARYLENSPDADTIRDRLAQAGSEGGARPSEADGAIDGGT